MKKLSLFAFLFLVIVTLPALAAGPADLVLRGGHIYTMDAARSWVEAVAIEKGRIVYAGDAPGVDAWIGKDTQQIQLDGRFAMPAFVDSHVHPQEAGLSMNQLDLSSAGTKEDAFRLIREYVAAHKDIPWILGDGWELPLFPGANPKKEWLDELVADRPALLWAADGHSAWVNSKALETAGVTRATPDPEGGRIEREADGNPSGTLRESATDLVFRHAPRPSREERVAGIQRALAHMNRLGITSFNDAHVSGESLEAYLEADHRGLLTARVSASIKAEPDGNLTEAGSSVTGTPSLEKVLEQVTILKQWREKYRGQNLRATTIKIFEDGVIEANTAAMLHPYLDRPNDSGKLLWEPEILNPFVEKIDREGFQVHFHAIGDRAVRVALDSLENARKKNGPRDARPFLAHIEVIDPADIPRFRSIGAIPCFQPLWAYEDSYITNLTLPKMSQDRWRWIYPIGSMAKTGVVLAMGSDWNVSSVNPLEGIEVAVTRRAAEDDPDAKDVFLPEERVDVATMLAAYTIGSAYTNFWEHEIGSIETGKSADLIVLSENPFDVSPSRLSDIQVLLTLFQGKTVYRDPSWK